jgi:hypothetical protein
MSLSLNDNVYSMSHRKLYNLMIFQCPFCPIRPLIFPLNQTYKLIIPFQLPSSTLPSVSISHSVCQTSWSFPSVYVIPKDLSKSVSLCYILQHTDFFYVAELWSLRPTTNLQDHPSSALRACSLHISAIIHHNRRTAFTLSLFIGTVTNITKNIKRFYQCLVTSVHSVLSLHVQWYWQCHNTDNRHWPQTALQTFPTKPLHSHLFTKVQKLLN